MRANIEKELVQGFVDEARSYILLIKSAIETLSSNTNRKSNLGEIHRLIQNIKGASSMIGVTELSHIANYVENILEDIASEKIDFTNDVLLFLRIATDQINKILDKLLDGTEDMKLNVDDIQDRHRRIYRNQELVDTNYEADKQSDDNILQSLNNSESSSNMPGELSDIFNSLCVSFRENKYDEVISYLSQFNNVLQDFKFKPRNEITDRIPFVETCIKHLSHIVEDISKSNVDDIRNEYISFADEIYDLINQFSDNSQAADVSFRKLDELAESYINYKKSFNEESEQDISSNKQPMESSGTKKSGSSDYSGGLLNDFLEEISNTSTEILQNLNDLASLDVIKPLIHKLCGSAGMLASQYGSNDNNKYTYIFRISGYMSNLIDILINPNSRATNLDYEFFKDSSNAICRLCDLEDYTYMPGIVLHMNKSYEQISDYHGIDLNLADADDKEKSGEESVNQYYESVERIPSELFDIFRIEANEHLELMKTQIDKYELNNDDISPLQEVRRGAHTIKGAASMVGLPVVSDLAFCIEESLDRVFEQNILPQQELTDLIKTSCEIIGNLVIQNVSDKTPEELGELKLKFNELNSYEEDFGADRISDINDRPEYQDNISDQALLSSENIIEDGDNGFDNNLADEIYTSTSISADIPDELLEVFLVEANEHFQNIGRYLNNISKDHADRDSLQELRRSIHTIKGAAGMVGYDTVSRLAHRMEDLLDNLYEGSLHTSDSIVDLLYRTYDLLEELINAKPGNVRIPDTLVELYNEYSNLLGEELAVTGPDHKTDIFGDIELQAEEVFDEIDSYIPPVRDSNVSGNKKKDQTIRKPGEFVRIPIERLDELVNLVSELVVNRSTFEQHFGRFTQELDEMSPGLERLRKVTTNLETEYEVITLGGGKIYAPTEHAQPIYDMPVYSSKSHDFDELQFDRYTQFHQHTRELTESASDIRAIGTQMRDLTGDFDSYLNRQQRVTSEVQDKLMRLRMVPLSTIITKLHRIARVTASQQNKRVELNIEGKNVELDKTVLEEMADPLLHIVRNSVDHGIELPELRRALNKKQTGTIFIKSFHEGTQVVLEIGDDGAGLVPEVLRNTAVKGGFVSETDSLKMLNEDLYKLIFLPGFSSATQISEISGRGVGMEIVSNTVNKLKGTITVKSVPSKGVTFTIRLPMTLAITKVLLVKTNNEIFAIPLASVSQIMRLEKGLIENLGDEKVIKIDNNLYPIIFLADALGLKSISEESAISLPVMIVKIGDKHIALVVEELLESREVVVKTLGSHLKRVHGITGATLMGDGSVVLIINPSDLIMEAPKVDYLVKPKISKDVRSGIFDVLIVDDSLSVRRIMSNLIKSHGWNPIISKDGVEALELIQRSVKLPDVILLDIEMPRMDGYELTSTLRSQGQFRNIPIIMITSRSGKKHREKAFELGATDYLVKPYQDKELIELIERLTGKITGTTIQ